MHVFLAVFLEVRNQLVEAHVIRDALHHKDVKHVRKASVADNENLVLY